MLLRCSVGRTKHNSMEHAFLFISRPSFRHYLKVINIIFVPVTFFSPQASDPDVWGRSQAQALNMNHYANKKSAAESMLDVALLMANASQLKAVLEQGPDFSFYTPIVTLISISLCLQVTVGVLLIFIVRWNLNDEQKHWRLNVMENLATGLVFMIVVVNVFITAFGVHRPNRSD
ncbi:Ninjurin-1 Nerve injury-induced protein 1 [Larimichthys crocea]|uniref:Ninjurin-1 Nerve injury-induced protein 1 n=1 Tax=Larimichthys crocea TaxID=215358 RepID=A0A6G0IQE8_LARCR|nr:Ninjurin-1 Nerve injury-induced protein 1 [Larimichthys crocea]